MSSPDYSGVTSCAPLPVHRTGADPRTRGARIQTGRLRQDLDDDAAVLSAPVAGLVRRDRLLFAVADHVDLVQRHLVLVIQIALDRLGTLEPELVVQVRGTGVVRVAFNFDVRAI